MADTMAKEVGEQFTAVLSESSFLSATPPTDAEADADALSNVASSLSSTPPTSVSPDNISISSEQGISKLITSTASMLEEPQPQLPSLAMQEVTKTPEPQSHPAQQTEHHSEANTEEQTAQQMDPSSDELSDPDSQLQREAEAQHLANPEPTLCELTPAASAIVVAPSAQPAMASPSTTPQRPRRARASLPVYNIAKLAGTDVHGRRRAKGDDVRTKPKRRVSAADALISSAAASSSTLNVAKKLVGDAIDALDMNWSVGAPSTPEGAKVTKKKSGHATEVKQEIATRRTTRLSSTPVPSAVTSALTAIGKRGKKVAEQGMSRISRELKRLQDTKEFAHVDDRPIIQTVWSNGKFVDPRTLDKPESRSSKRVKTSHIAEPEAEEKVEEAAAAVVVPEAELPQKKRTTKKWLDKGLYAGQETPKDLSVGLTAAEKKRLAQFPELAKVEKVNKTLPSPMFNGLRLLLQGRDFKLPYDICNPLPPGHPKPPAYRTMTKNRFVGDAAAYWKKQPHLQDFQSKCVCKPEDGCAEDCQNRIMLYECDETNCNSGEEHCQNRAFQSLTARTKKGGRFRVGVEVFKTEGKGYGVRSNRCFRPHQIIMEYTGEIITEAECERRMNEVYKDNECYYLMSFDQNMIIDATTGSIARFVNHSCSPNCRMIKWIVGGQPRMALFAGDKPIMTGEELTYDYNFDPFSAKNVQKCLCGAENCRGILGPKPREVKPPKAAVASKEELKKAGSKAAKRKWQELDDDVDDVEKASAKSAKKRKIAVATGAASSLSKSGLKAAKGAATALKRSVSSISLSAKAALTSKKTSSPLRRVSTGGIVKKVSPKKAATGAEKAKITTTKAALSALLATGALPAKKAPSRGSGASLAIKAATPKPKAKSALSTGTGNLKTKPKSPASSGKKTTKSPIAKSKATPKSASKTAVSQTISKRTPTASGKKTSKGGKQHSGYTPPSSPGPDDDESAPTPKLSARKKVPTRKVLESKSAGVASVTKPKAKPAAKAKSKVSAVAKRAGFMAAVRKAVRDTVSAASEDKGKGKGKARAVEREEEVMGQEATASPSPAAKSSIQAAPAGFTAINAAPRREEEEASPEREARTAMDVPRVNSQIRLVEG